MSKDTSKIKTFHANKNGWSNWVMPKTHFNMICCQCGHNHKMEWGIVFRMKKYGKHK